MDRQTTFLLALAMLVVAALVVSVSGWVLFLRDRALSKMIAHAHAGPASADPNHEVAEES